MACQQLPHDCSNRSGCELGVLTALTVGRNANDCVTEHQKTFLLPT